MNPPRLAAHLALLLILACSARSAVAQAPAQPRRVLEFADGTVLHALKIRRPDQSRLVGHLVTQDERALPRPLIVLLHGSGCDSVFARGKGGVNTPFLLNELRPYLQTWNVALVEKRGVEFGDRKARSGLKNCSDEYVAHATREKRIADAILVIEHVLESGLHDGGLVVVVGHSEGADVAAGVALHPRVTHLALFGFSTTHGLVGALATERRKLAMGEYGPREFERRHAALVERYRAIRADPDSSRNVEDHPHRRWSSYVFGQMQRDLVQLELPIFMGVASEDQAADPVGADMLVGEFVRLGKENLTTRQYVGLDHGWIRDNRTMEQYRAAQDLMAWLSGELK